MLYSVAVEEALLVLKLAFLVLLYLFIWRIVRSAARDVRMPQESFILAPSQAAELAALRNSGRLVVVRSPALSEGDELTLNSSALLLGRGSDNDVNLARDEFASSKHARVEPRRDGVWVEDVGSTNGTYLNGIRLTQAKRLAPGDVVRIGETELRYEG
jgi:pSer/pThr/pTyr-binding forkhead associated (FHA) protein